MVCPKTKHISAYLDAELQGSEKTSLETHLRGCMQCEATLSEMRALRAAFASAEHHHAPYGFATRVIARAAELEKKRVPWHVPLSLRFAEAAVLFIVVTVGILAGRAMTTSSAAAQTNITSSFSLDMFEATPPGSPGSAYLAMREVRSEK